MTACDCHQTLSAFETCIERKLYFIQKRVIAYENSAVLFRIFLKGEHQTEIGFPLTLAVPPDYHECPADSGPGLPSVQGLTEPPLTHSLLYPYFVAKPELLRYSLQTVRLTLFSVQFCTC
jgi:hypothetical protein